MRRLSEIFVNLKEEYSKLTWIAIAILIVSFVPDWQARLEYWSKAVRWTIPHLASPLGRVFLILCGIGIIWLDHRRVLAKHGKPHPKSLKARTLKLRDAMQAYLDKAPADDNYGNDSVRGTVHTASGFKLRVTKLHHGFELKFRDAVTRLFHEFGEKNVYDNQLAQLLSNPELKVNSESSYKLIIARLSDLAEMPEADS
jgi:hypothetical protein